MQEENAEIFLKMSCEHSPEQLEIVQHPFERILKRNVLGHKGFDLHTDDGQSQHVKIHTQIWCFTVFCSRGPHNRW